MPEKLIGRRGGANGKLRICSRPPDQVQSGPVQSPVFLYCSVHDRDTMHSRHRSNLLPRYQLSIRSIDENYAPNYPACIRYDHVFPASIQRTNIRPVIYRPCITRFIRENRNLITRSIDFCRKFGQSYLETVTAESSVRAHLCLRDPCFNAESRNNALQ